jgi:hypothetical protein
MKIALSILILVLGRLLPHPYNFTPLIGLILYSTNEHNVIKSLMISIIGMLISDYFISGTFTWYVYLTIMILTIIARYTVINTTPGVLMLNSISFSIIFFLITNAFCAPYYNSLLSSYIAGLPFLRNQFLGDIFYTIVFFKMNDSINYITNLKNERINI